jgi:hypothetical protein
MPVTGKNQRIPRHRALTLFGDLDELHCAAETNRLSTMSLICRSATVRNRSMPWLTDPQSRDREGALVRVVGLPATW